METKWLKASFLMKQDKSKIFEDFQLEYPFERWGFLQALVPLERWGFLRDSVPLWTMELLTGFSTPLDFNTISVSVPINPFIKTHMANLQVS